MTEVVLRQSQLVFELLPPLVLARWVPVGPSNALPRWAISGQGCSLLTSNSKPWEVLPVETGTRLCVLLLFIVLVILTFMAHVLDVNSFLERHCGQNRSRVQGQALL